METMQRARHGEQTVWRLQALSGAPLSPNLHVFTNLEALQAPYFDFLWRLPYIAVID